MNFEITFAFDFYELEKTNKSDFLSNFSEIDHIDEKTGTSKSNHFL